MDRSVKISPKYIMQLIPRVENELWGLFDSSKYKNVRRYILKWHEEYYDSYGDPENFHVFYKDNAKTEIDLTETLHRMDSEIVIKIAVDLGIDTPDLLPAIATIKNDIKSNNSNAYNNFNNAIKKVYEEPDVAVMHASSGLDDIIKTILEDPVFKNDTVNKNASLSKQIDCLLKGLGFNSNESPSEVKTIAKQLRSIICSIDNARSSKTSVHGKRGDDYIIDDSLWAVFLVNTCATLGLFLWDYYKTKYKSADRKNQTVDLSDLPF